MAKARTMEPPTSGNTFACIEIFPRRGYRMAVDFAEARRVFCTPGLRLGHGMLYNSQLTTRRHHMVCTVTTSHGYDMF